MRKKTNEEYKKELYEKWGDKVTALTEYTGNKNKIHHKCNICGNEFDARPNDILSGWTRWCPFCSNAIMGQNSRKTHDNYVKELEEKFPNKLTVLGEYITKDTPILHRCNTCGYEWNISPHNVLQGEGCPECKKITLSKLRSLPQNEYEKKLKEVWRDEIFLISDYKNLNEKAWFHCNNCNTDFYTWCRFLIEGHGCPNCNKSKGEKSIEIFLKEHNIEFEPQKRFDNCKNIRALPFDFYLPDYNIVIEFQGEQHYQAIEIFGGEEEFKKRVKNDAIKREWCLKEENPDLIEINKVEDISAILLDKLHLTKN